MRSITAIFCFWVLACNAVMAREIRVRKDYSKIQSAINAAEAGDTIIVDPGTYYETIDFKGKAITVQSSPAHPRRAIIMGDSTRYYCVQFKSGETNDSVLSGFRITNASTAVDCSSSSPSIINNVITGNERGITMSAGPSGPPSAPIICNNLISNNGNLGSELVREGAAILMDTSCPTILNNTIAYNTARESGGAIRCYSSGPMFSGNRIIHNSAPVGGAINLDTDGSVGARPILVDNMMAQNAGSSGGAIYSYRNRPILIGNLLIGNKATGGGAMRCDYAKVIGNTIAFNEAQAGGALSAAPHDPRQPDPPIEFENTIIWGNTATVGAQIWAGEGWFFGYSPTVAFTHCIVEGGEDAIYSGPNPDIRWGPGNIDADPLFVDPGHRDDAGTPSDLTDDTFILGDYHLLPGSPCIDAGTNDIDNPDTPEVETLPTTDIAGLPRVIDGDLDGTATVDIGAYEYLPGDVNYDGRVNVLDLILVRNSLGRDPASSTEAGKADVNADGSVNVLDLLVVRGRLGR